MTGLNPNTTYYVRAYATNSARTEYGTQVSFKTDVAVTIPTVTTSSITNITQNSATSGGNVTSEGGAALTAKGVCWSTSTNPTIANSKTTNGSGTGTFTSSITGLSANTTYYFRAYATNSSGTGYGEPLPFTTQAGTPQTGTFTDPRDSRTYKTVTIGTQTWMAENLAYLPFVVYPDTGSETIPYHYVYGYNGSSVSAAKATTNYQTYGVLYNWPAALSACPAGWHLPTDAEWTTLQNYLIANGYNYDGTTTGNKIAKSLAMASGWASHTGVGTVGNTDFPEKRNATGFSALPGGSRYSYGSFVNSGGGGYWWSATESSITNAWNRNLHYGFSDLYRSYGNKENGFSVRCLRD